MSAIFTDAVGAITTCPAWAEPATFTAPPADPVPVTIYRARNDPVLDVGGVDVRHAGWSAHVRQAEVPTRPRVNVDTLTVDGTTFQIRDVEEDEERAEWRLDLTEVPT